MIIFNYLFYRLYKFCKKSNSYYDIPVLGSSVGMLMPIFLMFIGIISILSELTSNDIYNNYLPKDRYTGFVFVILPIISLIYFFYRNKAEELEKKYTHRVFLLDVLPLWVILILYTIIAFAAITTMHKRGDGIFG